MKKNRRVLLFIPAYNCERQITRVLEQLDDEVLKYISEIIVVNNCSSDETEKMAVSYLERKPDLPALIIRNCQNYGLGGSHKVAFKYALEGEFDYLMVLHGDDQGNIRDILPYLRNDLAWDYDSFLGSRFEPGAQLVNYSLTRIWGNHIFNLMITILLKKKISDLGSGLNMYKVSYLKKTFYNSFPDDLTFNVYMLIYGIYSKSHFAFFPISWREDDQISNAKLMKQSKDIANFVLSYLFKRKRTFDKDRSIDGLERYKYLEVYRGKILR